MNKNKRPLISTRVMLLGLAIVLNMSNPVSLWAYSEYEPEYTSEWSLLQENSEGILHNNFIFNDGLFQPFGGPSLAGSNPNPEEGKDVIDGGIQGGGVIPLGDALPLVIVLAFLYGIRLFYLRRQMHKRQTTY